VVTLTGWVDSYAKRWAAQDAAHRVRGVKAVANEIEVRLLQWSERNDSDLAAAVVRPLEWDALINVDNLDVTASKGWVTLKGTVEWQYQKNDAERVVRRLTGVKGVRLAVERGTPIVEILRYARTHAVDNRDWQRRTREHEASAVGPRRPERGA